MTTKKTYFTPESPVLASAPTKTPSDKKSVVGPYRTASGWAERRSDGKEYTLDPNPWTHFTSPFPTGSAIGDTGVEVEIVKAIGFSLYAIDTKGVGSHTRHTVAAAKYTMSVIKTDVDPWITRPNESIPILMYADGTDSVHFTDDMSMGVYESPTADRVLLAYFEADGTNIVSTTQYLRDASPEKQDNNVVTTVDDHLSDAEIKALLPAEKVDKTYYNTTNKIVQTHDSSGGVATVNIVKQPFLFKQGDRYYSTNNGVTNQFSGNVEIVAIKPEVSYAGAPRSGDRRNGELTFRGLTFQANNIIDGATDSIARLGMNSSDFTFTFTTPLEVDRVRLRGATGTGWNGVITDSAETTLAAFDATMGPNIEVSIPKADYTALKMRYVSGTIEVGEIEFGTLVDSYDVSQYTGNADVLHLVATVSDMNVIGASGGKVTVKNNNSVTFRKVDGAWYSENVLTSSLPKNIPASLAVGMPFNVGHESAIHDGLRKLDGSTLTDAENELPDFWAYATNAGADYSKVWGIASVDTASGDIVLDDYITDGRFSRYGAEAGVLQDDATAVNSLSVGTAGNHRHGIDTQHNESNSGDLTPGGGGSSGTYSTNYAGDHTHTLTGDTETRPINVSVIPTIVVKPWHVATALEINNTPILPDITTEVTVNIDGVAATVLSPEMANPIEIAEGIAQQIKIEIPNGKMLTGMTSTTASVIVSPVDIRAGVISVFIPRETGNVQIDVTTDDANEHEILLLDWQTTSNPNGQTTTLPTNSTFADWIDGYDFLRVECFRNDNFYALGGENYAIDSLVKHPSHWRFIFNTHDGNYFVIEPSDRTSLATIRASNTMTAKASGFGGGVIFKVFGVRQNAVLPTGYNAPALHTLTVDGTTIVNGESSILILDNIAAELSLTLPAGEVLSSVTIDNGAATVKDRISGIASVVATADATLTVVTNTSGAGETTRTYSQRNTTNLSSNNVNITLTAFERLKSITFTFSDRRNIAGRSRSETFTLKDLTIGKSGWNGISHSGSYRRQVKTMRLGGYDYTFYIDMMAVDGYFSFKLQDNHSGTNSYGAWSAVATISRVS